LVVSPLEDLKKTAKYQLEEQKLIEGIEAQIGDGMVNVDGDVNGSKPPPDIFEDDSDYEDDTLVDPHFDKPEADKFTAETYNKYLSVNVLLPCGDTVVKGKVVA